jgi:hypothetical protein
MTSILHFEKKLAQSPLPEMTTSFTFSQHRKFCVFFPHFFRIKIFNPRNIFDTSKSCATSTGPTSTRQMTPLPPPVTTRHHTSTTDTANDAAVTPNDAASKFFLISGVTETFVSLISSQYKEIHILIADDAYATSSDYTTSSADAGHRQRRHRRRLRRHDQLTNSVNSAVLLILHYNPEINNFYMKTPTVLTFCTMISISPFVTIV